MNNDTNPSLTDPERGRKLMEKWGKILDFSGDKVVPTSLQKRLNTAIMIEGQETWLKPRLTVCPECKGLGRVATNSCNCGSGEGCSMHDEAAISMWGPKCKRCNGTGK